MGMMKYAEIIRIDLIEKATYIWNQLVWGMIMAIIIFIFVHIWKAIYSGQTIIEGFTLPQMIWYLAIAETMMFALGMDFIERIGEEVRTGVVGVTLLKPVSYVGKEFAQVMANFLFKFVVIGAIGLSVAQAMIGTIVLDIRTIPFFLLSALGACILNFLIICSLGLSAFWMEDSKSVFFIYQKLIFILGGMLVPIEIYPSWMSSWLVYFPTSFLIYSPAKLFVNFSWELFYHTIIGQCIWTLFFGMVLWLVYRQGIKKVTIHGG